MRTLATLTLLVLASAAQAQYLTTDTPPPAEVSVSDWLDRHLHVLVDATEPAPQRAVLHLAAIADGEVHETATVQTMAYGHPAAGRLAAELRSDLPAWDDYLRARRPVGAAVERLFPGQNFFPGQFFFPRQNDFPGQFFDAANARALAAEVAPEALDAGEPMIVFLVGCREGRAAVLTLRR